MWYEKASYASIYIKQKNKQKSLHLCTQILPHSKLVLMILVRRWETGWVFFLYFSSVHPKFSELSIYCLFEKKKMFLWLKKQNWCHVLFVQICFFSFFLSLAGWCIHSVLWVRNQDSPLYLPSHPTPYRVSLPLLASFLSPLLYSCHCCLTRFKSSALLPAQVKTSPSIFLFPVFAHTVASSVTPISLKVKSDYIFPF